MRSLPELVPAAPRFRTQEGVREAIDAVCAAQHDVATFHMLGESEEGRPLYGVVMGHGPHTVSLIAGAHADEPVGPETLRTLILEGLHQRAALADVLAAYRFIIVPHLNPDGEARNQPWIARWPDAEAFLQHVQRELPGRDVEFGFPDMRRENRLVADFLRAHAPYRLHMSLHGMAQAEGAMLLIERHWAFRTAALREGFATAVARAGLRLHDHNREGEKGFFYIAPGFTTTPEGAAMRTYFEAQGDEALAARFHDSSMEFVRNLGGDPLCLVTELPLFLVANEGSTPGRPVQYLAFKEQLPALQRRLAEGKSIQRDLEAFGLQALDLGTAMKLQLTALALGLDASG